MSRTERHLAEFARRKERLIARAEAQRATLGQGFTQLQGPIAIADQGLVVARFLKAHPVLVAVAVAALVAFRGRGLLSLAGRAYSVWRLWRSVSVWLSGRLA